MPWLEESGGRPVPMDTVPPPGMARAIASCAVSLPAVMVSGPAMDRVIAELAGRNSVKAWEKDPWLGGELFLDLDSGGDAEVAGFRVHDDRDDGLARRPYDTARVNSLCR
nr:hypothetical protein [Couchioplanes caeruleus]